LSDLSCVKNSFGYSVFSAFVASELPALSETFPEPKANPVGLEADGSFSALAESPNLNPEEAAFAVAGVEPNLKPVASAFAGDPEPNLKPVPAGAAESAFDAGAAPNLKPDPDTEPDPKTDAPKPEAGLKNASSNN
jgi:hypothetical protein